MTSWRRSTSSSGNQVLSGSETTGQLLGLRNVSGIESVVWTSATPTALELQKRVADSISRIASNLFQPPNAIVLHPRRWAWLLTQVDTANRPLVVPETNRPVNAAGVAASGAEGRVGTFCGLPVYLDGNIPTNVSTNQDLIIVADFGETYLYESPVRTRVLPEVLSGTLTLRLQLYGFVAMATRQAKSIAVISGTGTTTPVFS